VKIRFDRQRLITSAIMAVCIALTAYACSSSVTGTASVRPPAGVDRYIPAPGELILRQSSIGVDLAAGYRGYLTVGGQRIPTYDRNPNSCSDNTQPFTGIDAVFDLGQTTIMFTPSKGATIERFAPGEYRVAVTYWKNCESSDTARTASWTFKVS
jgi:hypothetical protein